VICLASSHFSISALPQLQWSCGSPALWVPCVCVLLSVSSGIGYIWAFPGVSASCFCLVPFVLWFACLWGCLLSCLLDVNPVVFMVGSVYVPPLGVCSCRFAEQSDMLCAASLVFLPAAAVLCFLAAFYWPSCLYCVCVVMFVVYFPYPHRSYPVVVIRILTICAELAA